MGEQSILARVRAEGYRDGIGQAGQVNYDDAFECGRRQAWREIGGYRRKWWAFGLLCGVCLSAIVGALP